MMESQRTRIRRLLQTGDAKALEQWLGNARNPFRILISLIFDSEPMICYGAVRLIGMAAGNQAVKDLEPVRRLIRRFFWMMNDESGNVGWKAPETIGEILHDVPQLIAEYSRLLSSFLDQEPFRTGVRIAVSRIASIDKSFFDEVTERKLTESLEDDNPDVRGTSIIALKALDVNIAESIKMKLASDQAEMKYFDFERGEMTMTTVGELAKLL